MMANNLEVRHIVGNIGPIALTLEFFRHFVTLNSSLARYLVRDATQHAPGFLIGINGVNPFRQIARFAP